MNPTKKHHLIFQINKNLVIIGCVRPLNGLPRSPADAEADGDNEAHFHRKITRGITQARGSYSHKICKWSCLVLHVCPFPHCAGSQVFSAAPSPSDCPPPRRASPMLGGPLFNLLLFFEVQLSPLCFNPPSEFPSISHPLHSLLTSPLFSAPSSHPTAPPPRFFSALITWLTAFLCLPFYLLSRLLTPLHLLLLSCSCPARCRRVCPCITMTTPPRPLLNYSWESSPVSAGPVNVEKTMGSGAKKVMGKKQIVCLLTAESNQIMLLRNEACRRTAWC